MISSITSNMQLTLRKYASSSSGTPTSATQAFEEKRMQVIEEIVTTEKTYHATLTVLLNSLLETMKQTSLTNNEVNLVKPLSADIYQLTTLSQQLLEDLQTKPKEAGRVFLKFAPFLQMVNPYIQKLQERQAALPKIKLANLEDSKLMSILITPVQRVPRFVLLLEQMEKYTIESNVDFKDTKEAVKVMQAVANRINESVREYETACKVFTLSKQMMQSPTGLDRARMVVYPSVNNPNNNNVFASKCVLQTIVGLKGEAGFKGENNVEAFLFADRKLVLSFAGGKGKPVHKQFVIESCDMLGENEVKLKVVGSDDSVVLQVGGGQDQWMSAVSGSTSMNKFVTVGGGLGASREPVETKSHVVHMVIVSFVVVVGLFWIMHVIRWRSRLPLSAAMERDVMDLLNKM